MATADVERRDHRFPCAQCGAVLRYAPGAQALQCDYCGSEQSTPAVAAGAVVEHDFHRALSALDEPHHPAAQAQLHCDSCGAHFDFDAEQRAGECPFCSAPVVVEEGATARFKPESLLPFVVEEARARAAFERWIGGLWFAPSALARQARADSALQGVYLPHWTYDSDTHSRYRGERGTTYYVTQWVTVVRNGRRVRQRRRVAKVRWRPVQGAVRRHFDDVLVGAAETLPRQITDRLQPWDLDALVPWKPAYLAGMRSEVYQVPLDEGFERARQVMAARIRRDCAADIGGDFQRVHSVQTQHHNTTFKHILLPIWSAGFRYRGRQYRFVVNGRNAQVAGERPYSGWKIAAAVLAGALALGAALLVFADAQHSGAIGWDRPGPISSGWLR